ncbi:OmpA family protein [Desulfovibrio sp. OttesenSCG-928-C06]|nr:OmpA family protein [Desulfovibrio sp. OttesenSCG-928-C06]
MSKYLKALPMLLALCCLLTGMSGCAKIPDKSDELPVTPKARNAVQPCDEPGYAGAYGPGGQGGPGGPGWAGNAGGPGYMSGAGYPGQYPPAQYDPYGRQPQSGWAGWSEPEKQAAGFINSAPVYFHYDSAALTPQAQAVLRQKAERIKAFPQLRVTVAGHCDERGTDSYNYALGQRRAKAALDYLVKLGVSRDQLETISYGKSRPVVAGQGEGVWSLNRRDEFNITKR